MCTSWLRLAEDDVTGTKRPISGFTLVQRQEVKTLPSLFSY